MTEAIYVTHDQVKKQAKRVAEEIKREHPSGSTVRLYGVPRGGIPPMYLVSAYFVNVTIVSNPKQAHFIIDDLVDSGATRDHHKTHYPNAKFLALFNKQQHNISAWLILPWENNETQSASDIPTRLLQYVGEDPARGGLLETPNRFLKAWKHYTSGYGKKAGDVLKVFEDGAENCNELVIVKDIPIFSHCEHHMCPFYGHVHIGYIPDGKIVGLSKLVRVADIFMRRLQVQERLTNQIADALEKELQPIGVAVSMTCAHTCMIGRGVSIAGSTTITSAMRGAFLTNPETRAEFMGFIK